MKRMGLVLLAALVVVPCAYGATNQVLSRNAVGYERLTAYRGAYHLIRHDFFSLDGTPQKASDILGSQVPVGSAVYFWDAAEQKYTATETLLPIGWSPDSNLFEGAAFWLSIPDGVASSEYQVYLMGEVPDSLTQTQSTTDVVGGGAAQAWNIIGYKFPASILFTNTDLAKAAQTGDALYMYNPTSGYTVTATKLPIGWSPSDIMIEPGQAFWFSTTTSQTWHEVKPYTWP